MGSPTSLILLWDMPKCTPRAARQLLAPKCSPSEHLVLGFLLMALSESHTPPQQSFPCSTNTVQTAGRACNAVSCFTTRGSQGVSLQFLPHFPPPPPISAWVSSSSPFLYLLFFSFLSPSSLLFLSFSSSSLCSYCNLISHCNGISLQYEQQFCLYIFLSSLVNVIYFSSLLFTYLEDGKILQF